MGAGAGGTNTREGRGGIRVGEDGSRTQPEKQSLGKEKASGYSSGAGRRGGCVGWGVDTQERQMCWPRMSGREGPLKETKTRTETIPWVISFEVPSDRPSCTRQLPWTRLCAGTGQAERKGLAPVHQAPPGQEMSLEQYRCSHPWYRRVSNW